jgi:hypothetical protein
VFDAEKEIIRPLKKKEAWEMKEKSTQDEIRL